MRHNRGFTLLELALVVLVIAVLIGLLLPMFARRRHPRGRPMENSSRLRGISQNMVIYANGNNGHYPGLNPDGSPADLTVEGRYQILLDNDYFTGAYIVSPQEQLTAWTPGDPVVAANYSYTMLEISTDGERPNEWRETLNSDAVVLGDRNVGTDATANAQSIWTTTPGEWRGSVAWNDGHVTFETTNILEKTQYANAPAYQDDNLFRPGDATDTNHTSAPTPAGNDTHMIHTGQ